MEITATWYLVLSSLLFTVGAVGVLIRRNPLVMFMCVELMLNAVNLTFVTFSRAMGSTRTTPVIDPTTGQPAIDPVTGALSTTETVVFGDVSGEVVVFFVLVVAAAEVVVGLGIIVAIMRNRDGATADDLNLLRG